VDAGTFAWKNLIVASTDFFRWVDAGGPARQFVGQVANLPCERQVGNLPHE